MLSFRKLTLRRGPRVLLRELDATVHAGQRLGIVGRNGTGKSSLFALIRGEVGADAGEFQHPHTLQGHRCEARERVLKRASLEIDNY